MKQSTSALIIGSPLFLGRYVALKLIQHNISIDFYSPQEKGSPAELTHSGIKFLTSLPEKGYYHYVFFLDRSSHSKERTKLLKTLSQLATTTKTLILNPPKKLNLSPTSNQKIVFITNLYGPGVTLPLSPVETLFHKTNQGNIVVATPQDQQVSPLFVSDAADLLLRFMFTRSTNKISFQGSETLPLISLAYKVQSQAQKHQLSLVITSSDTPFSQTPTSSFQAPKTPTLLTQGLNQTLSWFAANIDSASKPRMPLRHLPTIESKPQEGPVKVTPIVSSVSPTSKFTVPPAKPKTIIKPTSKTPVIKPTKTITKIKSTRKPLPRFLTTFLVLVFLFIFLNLLNLIMPLFLTRHFVTKAFTQTGKSSQISAETWLNHLKNRLSWYQIPLNLLLGPSFTTNTQTTINFVGRQLEVKLHSQSALTSANAILDFITGIGSEDFSSHLTNLSSEIDFVYRQASLFQADPNLSNLQNHKIFKWLNLSQVLITSQEGTSLLRNQLTQVDRLINILPEVIGLAPQAKKTYLILLQNSSELRPTGGFIGSFGLLTFENGQLLDYQIQDVYSADAQLRGQVVPPSPIRLYLGETSWYLRDVNWDPDFPTSAVQSQWFVNKEISRQVDGVIALNTYALKMILEATGPITIADTNETISSQNILDRAQYHSDVEFNQETTKKPDFLGSVSLALYQQLSTLDTKTLTKFAQSISQAATENQLLISLNTPLSQTTINDLTWSGGLLNPKCPQQLHTQTCLLDYLASIEANVGVNKSNFFIDRQLDHRVSINPNDIQATTILTLKNNSPSNSWPAGTYKTYLRIYAPKSATLKRITVDSAEIPLDLIDTSIEHSKKVFGFYTEVPIQTSSTINISYQLNRTLPSGTATAYTLLVQKQSGTATDPLSVIINYHPGLKPLTIAPTGTVEGDSVIFKSTLDKNRFFTIEFAR